MLFLQPAVSKRRFISGLSAAVEDETRASYSPLKNNGAPTTARAGVAFPENDWLTFPDGDQYLANVGGSAAATEGAPAALRRRTSPSPSLACWRQSRKTASKSTSPRSSRAQIEDGLKKSTRDFDKALDINPNYLVTCISPKACIFAWAVHGGAAPPLFAKGVELSSGAPF